MNPVVTPSQWNVSDLENT